MALNYPALPWVDGQQAEIMPGMNFRYSSSLKKWVPISPRYDNSEQLKEAFDVETVEELNSKFAEVDASVYNLTVKSEQADSDIALSGRIWKTAVRPNNPNNNDIWMHPTDDQIYSYNSEFDTWVAK